MLSHHDAGRAGSQRASPPRAGPTSSLRVWRTETKAAWPSAPRTLYRDLDSHLQCLMFCKKEGSDI